MNFDELIRLTKIELHECGFRHAKVRECPKTFRDDAMNSRCVVCEHIIKECLCEWGSREKHRL